MRKQIAAANWKMNCTLQQANDLIDGLIKENISASPYREVVIAVPFPYLMMAKEKLKPLMFNSIIKPLNLNSWQV